MTNKIRVRREVFYKRDANRIAGWMKKCKFDSVRIDGIREDWEVNGISTSLQLTKFCMIEAQYDRSTI